MVVERYRDSEALIEHMANLGDLGAILATVSVVHGELLGEPSAELRAKMADPEILQLFMRTSRCRHRSPAWAPAAGRFRTTPRRACGGDESAAVPRPRSMWVAGPIRSRRMRRR
jgi:hypothetical protein